MSSTSSKPQHCLLITVGSTLFQRLTSSILSTPILDLIVAQGVASLIVQLGNADFPTHLELSTDTMREIKSGSGTGELKTTYKGLDIRVLRFTPQLGRLVSEATHVVSHAGSGTILDVLRRTPPPRFLVVPNTSLMDDHQQELAQALGEANYLDVCLVDDLQDGLKRLFSDHPRKPFPPPQPTFRSILDETAGYA